MRAASLIPLVLVCASLSAWGQGTTVLRLPGPPPLALPDWLAPFPLARDQSVKATSAEVRSTYTAQAPTADVVSHYEKQMRTAGIAFQMKRDGTGASIDVSLEKTSCAIRVSERDGGSKVEVNCGLKPDPQPAPEAARVLPSLRLEWPGWLEVPGGRLVTQRTNPPGRIGGWLEETCPGDVLGKPSQGCLARVYETSSQMNVVYEYFGGLLEQYGYTTQNISTQPYANLQLGKFIGDVFASLTVRQYPDRHDENYYRQINVFMRQPPAGKTKVEITFTVKNGQSAEANTGLPSTASTAPSGSSAPTTTRSSDRLSFPPPRGTWRWVIQSVAARRGSEIKYTSFYYEAATDRSVDEPLTLPDGAEIVGVFPDDCVFSVRDDLGHSLTFRNEDEAKAKGLGPGTWSVFPLKCGGVAVFLK